MRIIIADDEHLMATGLANAVASIGHTVVGPFADGAEALEAASNSEADMCVLDVRMPRMTGLEAASEIWDRYQIPTILLSAYTDDEYIERAAQPGVFGYLVKPVDSERLRITIEMARNRVADRKAQTDRISQLETTLTNRRRVEQAKWHLVDTQGIAEPEAHALIQRVARDNRSRLIDVADDILNGELEIDPSGG